MSLSPMPPINITFHSAQDISDEILGCSIHFCKESGYPHTIMMITFFHAAFLLSVKTELLTHNLIESILGCYARSISHVFPDLTKDKEHQSKVDDMCRRYWCILSSDYFSLSTNTEISALLQVANKLASSSNIPTDNLHLIETQKCFSKASSVLLTNIHSILHQIDNSYSISYKYSPDEINFASKSDTPSFVIDRNASNCQSRTIETDQTPQLGMTWYKHLVSFALVFGAIINFIYAFSYLTGTIYMVQTSGEVSSSEIYNHYGGTMGILHIVDIIYGILLIISGILSLTLRCKLVEYSPTSIDHLHLSHLVSFGTLLLYIIVVATITSSPVTTNAVLSLVVSLLFWILNSIYFKKRAHLFTSEPESAQYWPQSLNESSPIFTSTPKGDIATNHHILFCRKCGAKLLEDSKFCHRCGSQIC